MSISKMIKVVAFSLLYSSSSWAGIININILPSDSDVTVGESFTLDIVADISEPILGWGMDLDFLDPIFTQISPPIIGPLFNAAPSLDGDGLSGLFNPIASPFPVFGASGTNVVLASLTLQAVSAGNKLIIGSDNSPTDFTEGFAETLPGALAQVNYIPFNLSIRTNNSASNPVPAPESGWLMLLGLALLARKYKQVK